MAVFQTESEWYELDAILRILFIIVFKDDSYVESHPRICVQANIISLYTESVRAFKDCIAQEWSYCRIFSCRIRSGLVCMIDGILFRTAEINF